MFLKDFALNSQLPTDFESQWQLKVMQITLITFLPGRKYLISKLFKYLLIT